MNEKRRENPKHAAGVRKVPYSPVPERVSAEVGLAMFEGARKYGRHNFRAPGTVILASDYYDAMRRHLADWWEGQDIDPDSGLHHLIKLMASGTVLRDAMHTGAFVDDRPPKSAEGWMTELNARASEIIDRYPNPKLPTTQKECE